MDQPQNNNQPVVQQPVVPPILPPKSHRWVLGIVAIVVVVALGIGFTFIKFNKSPKTSSPTRTTINAYGDAPVAGEDYVDGEIIFGFKDGFDMDSLPNSIRKQISQSDRIASGLSIIYLAKLAQGTNVLDLMTSLQRRP